MQLFLCHFTAQINAFPLLSISDHQHLVLTTSCCLSLERPSQRNTYAMFHFPSKTGTYWRLYVDSEENCWYNGRDLAASQWLPTVVLCHLSCGGEWLLCHSHMCEVCKTRYTL